MSLVNWVIGDLIPATIAWFLAVQIVDWLEPGSKPRRKKERV